MQQHWRSLIVLFGLILVAFVSGLAFESIMLSLASMMSGLVVAFVMATAFLRAEGHSPEHHARVDRWLDDTNA